MKSSFTSCFTPDRSSPLLSHRLKESRGYRRFRRGHVTCFLLLLAALLCRSAAPVAAAEISHPKLQPAIDQIRKAAGSAAFQLIALPSGQVVCQERSSEAFVPASLVKLLTSYAALKKLSPAFRFTTQVFATSDPVDGIVQGDIWIRGSGDPFFVDEKVQLLVQALKDRGIRQIRGGIIADNSFFLPAAERICLDTDCIGLYNPVISAAAVDFNQLTVKVSAPAKPGKAAAVDSAPAGSYVRLTGQATFGKKGGNALRVRSLGAAGNGQEQFQVTGQISARGARSREYRFQAADPAGLFAHAIRTALERSGIKVEGSTVREGTTPQEAKVIAAYESPPLSELVSVLNKYSNNFMAEMVLRSLGGYIAGPPGTSAKGIAVVEAALREAGIPGETGVLDCGSGLSRLCRVSPQTFCRLLFAAWNDPSIQNDFISSLAANAEEGTLRRRMHKPGLIVRGKTGTLNDVIGFAGYVSGPSGRTYAAAIMLNDVRDRFKARQAIDTFLEEVGFTDP